MSLEGILWISLFSLMALSQSLWNSGSSWLTTIGLIAICSFLGVLPLWLAWSRDSLCPFVLSRLSTSSSYLALNLLVSLSMFWSGLSACGLVGLVGCDGPMYWVKMPSDSNSSVSLCLGAASSVLGAGGVLLSRW